MSPDPTPTRAPPPWRRPRVRARPALALFALFVGVGLVQGVAVRAGLASEGGQPSYEPIVWHVTGAVGAWLALPFVQIAVANAPGPRVGWPRLFSAHAAGYLAFAAAHFAAMAALRLVLGSRLAGATPARRLEFQLLWELQSDLVLYGGLASLWSLLHAWDERREATVRAARLDAQLASARLEALSAQLDPHFLFNALNTVSALMYEDLPRTERLLSDLGQILRATLKAGGAAWTLADERAHTERYVGLLSARFGGRLAVAWDVPEGLGPVRLPRFAVQTLVENAVKHNRDRRGPLAIRIWGDAGGDEVRLVVDDDGRGFGRAPPPAADGAGRAGPGPDEARRGLDRLRETLRLLHGERARLERSSAPGGGARVSIYLPREGG
jgi:two-component system LytT family sensor kinase